MGAFEQAPLLFFGLVFIVGAAGGYVGSYVNRKLLHG